MFLFCFHCSSKSCWKIFVGPVNGFRGNTKAQKCFCMFFDCYVIMNFTSKCKMEGGGINRHHCPSLSNVIGIRGLWF